MMSNSSSKAPFTIRVASLGAAANLMHYAISTWLVSHVFDEGMAACLSRQELQKASVPVQLQAMHAFVGGHLACDVCMHLP
eukprot:3830051-Amphidinium_carterae.1